MRRLRFVAVLFAILGATASAQRPGGLTASAPRSASPAQAGPGVASPAGEKIDYGVLTQIRDEGLNRSQVMEIVSWLADVYGPRLTGSPRYTEAADWAKKRMTQWASRTCTSRSRSSARDGRSGSSTRR